MVNLIDEPIHRVSAGIKKKIVDTSAGEQFVDARFLENNQRDLSMEHHSTREKNNFIDKI